MAQGQGQQGTGGRQGGLDKSKEPKHETGKKRPTDPDPTDNDRTDDESGGSEGKEMGDKGSKR